MLLTTKKASPKIALACFALFFHPVSTAGMVAFFDVPDFKHECPEGWVEYAPAKGRLIQGTTVGDKVGEALGTPLKDQTPHRHSHTFRAGVTLEYEPVTANGGPNPSLTSANTEHVTTGTSGESDGDLPYMQLLACEQKDGYPAQDALPREMTAFFTDQQCPKDWEPYEKLNGRFAVPLPPDGANDFNAAVGPWNEAISHDHYMYVSDAAAEQKIYLPVSEASVALAKHFWPFGVNESYGKRTFPDRFYRTASNTDVLPRVSLMACRRVAGRTRTSQLPDHMLGFMTAKSCPKHWRQKPASMGRFLIGLPAGQFAQSGIPFGGSPLKSKEVREHTHSIRADLKLPSHGIAGASGCCSGDYAAAGTYTMQGDTVKTISTLPYVQIRHCIVTPTARKSGG